MKQLPKKKSKNELWAWAIIAFFGAFYFMGITVGLPKDLPVLSDHEIEQMLKARDNVIAYYETSDKNVLDKKAAYWNKRREPYLQARTGDSNRTFTMLANMKTHRGNQLISYNYGMTYLLPLGAYLYVLDKLSIINVHADVAFYLRNTPEVAKLFIANRVFIIIFTLLGMIVLYRIALRYVPREYALLTIIMYGLVPLVTVYAHDIKPWLYVNFFFLLAFYYGEKHYIRASIFAGLAMGSMTTAGFVLIWIIMNNLDARKIIIAATLCAGVFIITNPYWVLDWTRVSYFLKQAYPQAPQSDITYVFKGYDFIFGTFLFPLCLLSLRDEFKVGIFTLFYCLVASYLGYYRLFFPCIALVTICAMITVSKKNFLLPFVALQLLLFVALDLGILNYYINNKLPNNRFVQRYIDENYKEKEAPSAIS
jgi:hypothetical protein